MTYERGYSSQCYLQQQNTGNKLNNHNKGLVELTDETLCATLKKNEDYLFKMVWNNLQNTCFKNTHQGLDTIVCFFGKIGELSYTIKG